MRRLWIVFVAAMLLVSCHHKKLQEQTDSMPVVHEVAEDVDTTTATAHDDVAPHPAELQMELDSAEITNLRLFTRKQRVVYNPALLMGEWLNGSEHTLFVSDGSGWFWDTSDSITRETAQLFEWAMDSNLLVFKYTLALGGVVPRLYVVTYVDDESLVYRDSFGESFMWDKVQGGFTDRAAVSDDTIFFQK